ncbi:MAG: hypothetical protein AAFY51_13190, partial [Pseudomonadota bacterium]
MALFGRVILGVLGQISMRARFFNCVNNKRTFLAQGTVSRIGVTSRSSMKAAPSRSTILRWKSAWIKTLIGQSSDEF